MPAIETIHKVTKQLFDHLEQPLPEEDHAREDYLDITDFLLEKRALMLKQPPSHLILKRSLGNEIVEMNRLIEEKLRSVKARIGRDLKQTRALQHVENQYTRSHTVPSEEGFYFDKKN